VRTALCFACVALLGAVPIRLVERQKFFQTPAIVLSGLDIFIAQLCELRFLGRPFRRLLALRFFWALAGAAIESCRQATRTTPMSRRPQVCRRDLEPTKNSTLLVYKACHFLSGPDLRRARQKPDC